MNRTVVLLSYCCFAAPLSGRSVIPIPDWGVVCLDETTGRPLWEYFPAEVALFQMGIVMDRFVVAQRSATPPFDARGERTIALDPVTGRVLNESAQPAEGALLHPYFTEAPNMVTRSGNRIVADPGNARGITILKGDGPEVSLIISTNSYYSFVIAYEDLVIYGASQGNRLYSHAPALVAVDSASGREVWSLEDFDYPRGIAAAKGVIYVCEFEALRAIEPTTGRTIWRRSLPRIKGWSRVYEQGDDVFVTCDMYGGMSSSPYLYCIAASDGSIRWTFNPYLSETRLPLVFHGGRIYTYISTSDLARAVAHGSQNAAVAGRDWLSPKPRFGSLKGWYSSKTPEEVELNARAWHAFGDRSLVYALNEVVLLAEGTALHDPLVELTRTFPAHRDSMALLAFLAKAAEESPDLRPEIRRILDAFDPRPFWMQRPERMRHDMETPTYDLEPIEAAVVDAFVQLKTKADSAPITRLTPEAVHELFLNKGTASFERLLQAHEDTPNEQSRLIIRMAMYAQHPREASDWRLTKTDAVGALEISQWVQRAPIDWLLEHESLYERWLQHEDNSVRSFSAGRLYRNVYPQVTAPFCTKLLERGLVKATKREIEGLLGALRGLALTHDRSYAPLLRRYLRDIPIETSERGSTQDGRLRMEAELALAKLGIAEPSAPAANRVATPAAKSPCSVAYDLRLQIEMADGSPRSEVEPLARRIIELNNQGLLSSCTSHAALMTAYEAVGDWDVAIRHALQTNNIRDLVRIYQKAGRIAELVEIGKNAPEEGVRIRTAVGLTMLNRPELAEPILEQIVQQNPNEADARITLAVVYSKTQSLERADSMMESAIALRPSPWVSDVFQNTITYWLERGKPERAIAWMRESARIDRAAWDSLRLFDWAAQFAQLKDASDEVRQSATTQDKSPAQSGGN